jgi:hypothetical protein
MFGSAFLLAAGACLFFAGAALVDSIVSAEYRDPEIRALIAAIAAIGALSAVVAGVGWVRGGDRRWLALGQAASALTTVALATWLFASFALGHH